jgi:hypothetical protein
MPKCQNHAPQPLPVCLALMLMLLSACSTIKPRPVTTLPPHVNCQEHAIPEPLPAPPSQSTDYLAWRRAWHEAVGVLIIEEQKRVTTAACLDRLRGLGVIR